MRPAARNSQIWVASKTRERVWKRTRRNRLHNVYFPKLTLVVQTVEAQLVKWSVPNAELAALCQL